MRPVLVLTETVIDMAITSQPQKAGFPFTLALPLAILPKLSWVKNLQIRTVSVDRLGKKIAAADAKHARTTERRPARTGWVIAHPYVGAVASPSSAVK
jgi:mRNA-degrading endonuclease toxin of MazEF toxin-antitoxin module